MTKICITTEGQKIFGVLNDSAASRDFLSLLPLTLTLEDYSKTEKISDLPKRLSTQDAPAGFKPKAGDITFYAPWGNLAIFYRDFSYASGLISLGEIKENIDLLAKKTSLKVIIEKID
ncbi:cyclophilin-like fold protein [Cellvibrio sp. NN19]|uniref:cyclophilin-like fold protein n=1 Tax=Cellvibrio chitinivorans TaxID=3102792 RepID=UPI002B413EEB|nr:cyclophilin-like fold protein [Cellvibrio sp. NN19]